MDAVVAEFEFDVREHVRASSEVLKRSRQLRNLRLMFLPAVGYGIWLAWRTMSAGYSVTTGILNGLPWILVFVVLWFLFPFLQLRAASKIAATDPAARGVQRRVVDADGFHSRGNNVALDVPWAAMHRVVETTEFFLFYYNRDLAYYLGKSRLSSEGLARVRDYARQVPAA